MVDNGEGLIFPTIRATAQVPGANVGDVDFSRIIADVEATELARRQAVETAANAQSQAEREAAEAERRWYKERDERSAALVGTDPETLFGPEGATLCRSFLTYMAERGYPRSRRLSGTRRVTVPIEGRGGVMGAILGTTRTETSEVRMKGYLLGYDGWPQGPGGYFTRASMRHHRRAYLCEDGKIRSGKHDKLLGDIGMDKKRGDRLVVAMGDLEKVKVEHSCSCSGGDVQPHRCETTYSFKDTFIPVGIKQRLLEIARQR